MTVRGQVASLDLMLSVVVFLLFLALIIGSILIAPRADPFIYGESITERLTIVNDHVLDRSTASSLNAELYNETIFDGTRYPVNTPYCITIPGEAILGTACAGIGFDFDSCDGIVEQHATNVLDPDDNTIKRLTVWVCT